MHTVFVFYSVSFSIGVVAREIALPAYSLISRLVFRECMQREYGAAAEGGSRSNGTIHD